MTRTTVLIPYYGGSRSPANGNSPVEKRRDYLRYTVSSLRGISDDIRVGVCREEDLDAVASCAVQVVMTGTLPQFIPAGLCRAAQEQGTCPQVYVTEADQVLQYSGDVLAKVQGFDYLVPHRLEQLGPQGQGHYRGPNVTFGDYTYAICNGAPEGDGFYSPRDVVSAYGGAFLASRELFRAIEFKDPTDLPVENVTGFYAFCTGYPWKTSRWQDFFVEHLSGYDYHCSL